MRFHPNTSPIIATKKQTLKQCNWYILREWRWKMIWMHSEKMREQKAGTEKPAHCCWWWQSIGPNSCRDADAKGERPNQLFCRLIRYLIVTINTNLLNFPNPPSPQPQSTPADQVLVNITKKNMYMWRHIFSSFKRMQTEIHIWHLTSC